MGKEFLSSSCISIVTELFFFYSTAAIKHRNGTINNVVKIPGTKVYIQAMKDLAEDALRVRAGKESQL
jgi:hypothetical protein